MLMNDEIMGVISVQSYRPNAYGESEEELLSTIADTVAVALERARLFEEAARRARLLTILNAAAIQIQQSFDTEHILRAASDQVRRIGTMAHILLVGADSQLKHLHTSMSKEMVGEFVAAFGERKFEFQVPLTTLQEEWERLTVGETFVRTGLIERIANQLSGEEQLVGKWMLEKSHNAPSLIAPLNRADKTIGMIVITGDQFGDSDIPAVALFARHISVALDNARLFQEIQQELNERKNAEAQIQRQLRRLAALHSIDTAISSSLDLRVTFDVILDQVTSQLHADAADIILLNPFLQMLQYAAGRGFRSRTLLRNDLPLGKGLAGRAALERKVIHIPNLDSAADDLAGSLRRANESFVSYHALPLMAKGEVKGVLEIFHRTRFEPDQEWLDFLETLAAQAAIAIDNMALFDTLQRSNTELSLAYDTTLEGWSHALEMRDRETEGHTLRVADETVRLAKAMGIADADLVHIRRGALLHDIGKMGIPDNILLKPGPLNDDEWKIMRNHPTHAYELLAPIDYLQSAIDIPYCHHEKWDGTGYPRGLEREQIPLAARIFAVVDIWDALSSERPYRGSWKEDRVREYIQSISGTHLDPHVVESFLNLGNAPPVR
jgi:putative nucleotidyltransferase with HDIG domain